MKKVMTVSLRIDPELAEMLDAYVNSFEIPPDKSKVLRAFVRDALIARGFGKAGKKETAKRK